MVTAEEGQDGMREKGKQIDEWKGKGKSGWLILQMGMEPRSEMELK